MVACFRSNPGIVGTVTRAGPVKAWCAWKLQMSEADQGLIYIYIYIHVYLCIRGMSNRKGNGHTWNIKWKRNWTMKWKFGFT